jgi:uncharacterized membrane protein YbhN (UPF0104 family)
MLTRLGAALRSYVGWRWAGALLSMAVAGIALFALANVIRNVHPEDIAGALRQTSTLRAASAFLLVIGSYLSLTAYDLLAVRTIGLNHISYRTAALSSFVSYPIAHGIGAVLPISAAIRYRIYSAHGVSAGDVARICFLTGTTFWLGNLTMLGLSGSCAPLAIGPLAELPRWTSRMLAMTLLLGILVYLGWVGSRARIIGRDKWTIRLPSGRAALVQLAVGIVDLSCAAAAMYMLIPPDMNAELANVAAIFAAAMVLGFVSHMPGGIGAFDATILIGLGGEHDEPLIAALLLFRLFYHVIPFVLALLIYGALEGWRSVPKTP